TILAEVAQEQTRESEDQKPESERMIGAVSVERDYLRNGKPDEPKIQRCHEQTASCVEPGASTQHIEKVGVRIKHPAEGERNDVRDHDAGHRVESRRIFETGVLHREQCKKRRH